MSGRYDTASSPEGQYQPGSNDQVLLNKLAITDIEEMEQAEFDALADLQDVLFDELEADQQITSSDLSEWHRRWLGNIYEWAGTYRSVNMAKAGFMFAAANLIFALMNDLDKKYLAVYTPCDEMDEDTLAEALAIVHVEFIIVHPFREGNGRLGRLLATVMALQAGMPLLDFELMEMEKDRYIAAIHAGLGGEYAPMTRLFSEILQFSLRQASGEEL